MKIAYQEPPLPSYLTPERGSVTYLPRACLMLSLPLQVSADSLSNKRLCWCLITGWGRGE